MSLRENTPRRGWTQFGTEAYGYTRDQVRTIQHAVKLAGWGNRWRTVAAQTDARAFCTRVKMKNPSLNLEPFDSPTGHDLDRWAEKGDRS